MSQSLERYDVELSKPGEYAQRTHVFAVSHEAACARMERQLARAESWRPGIWAGWTCTVQAR